MYFTPIGVFCTIVPVVEANGTETIISLATQLIILYVAFFGFALVIYGGSVKFIGKESPVKFFKAMLPAALNAFGTCSSSATIPISKQRMEDEMGVSNKITSIAIPLGATVNMDAVSILMSFMIMFFANACGINVSISMMIIILLANVLLSVGTRESLAVPSHPSQPWQPWQVCLQELWAFTSASIHSATWAQPASMLSETWQDVWFLRRRLN